MEGGAFGGAKMGAAFDPIAFVQRPQVILRALCMLFAIVVFGCISSQGWYVDDDGRSTCMYGGNSGACNYGTGVAVIAFLAAGALLAGEALFERVSSAKTRRHFVVGDLAFCGFWTFLYFVSFCFLTNAWSNATNIPKADSKNPVQAAIAFSFFSIFTWGASAYLAYQRFKQGTGTSFASGYEQEAAAGGAAYSGYPGAMDGAADPAAGYQEPFSQPQQPFAAPQQPFAAPQQPFAQPQQTGQNFQPPAY